MEMNHSITEHEILSKQINTYTLHYYPNGIFMDKIKGSLRKSNIIIII